MKDIYKKLSLTGKGDGNKASKAPLWLLLIVFSFAVIFLFMSAMVISVSIIPIFIMVIIWGFLLFVIFRFAMSQIVLLIIVVVLAITSYFYVQNFHQTDTSTQDQDTRTISTTPATVKDRPDTADNNSVNVSVKEGVIYVEAEEGSLSNAGQYSRVGENKSRGGGEAYLGDGGAVVSYLVPVEKAGSYELWINITDDAKHADGSRNATVKVNDQTLYYKHISKDTNGWEWVKLGNVTLKVGNNSVSFTKDRTTSAAFVMDAFKFVPSE